MVRRASMCAALLALVIAPACGGSNDEPAASGTGDRQAPAAASSEAGGGRGGANRQPGGAGQPAPGQGQSGFEWALKPTALPSQDDFDAKAELKITRENFQQELDRLKKELEADTGQ